MRKQSIGIVLGLALLLTLTAFGRDDCRIQTSLQPTAEEAAIDASGHADARARDHGYYETQQRLKVQVEADLADDSLLYVFANDDQFVGTITMQAQRGELEFDNDEGTPVPPEIGPVCQLRNILVLDVNGTLILFGEF